MTPPMIDIRLGGLNLRVPQHGTPAETQAIADTINARLKELENASSKVNTQAFALQAAYDFACESAQLQKDVKDAEMGLVKTLNELAGRIDEFRNRIAASSGAEA